jgi:hypothetical protein
MTFRGSSRVCGTIGLFVASYLGLNYQNRLGRGIRRYCFPPSEGSLRAARPIETEAA